MMRRLFILFCIGLLSTPLQSQVRLKTLVETEPHFDFCEGFAPDPSGQFLYLTNTVGNPLEADGKGFISRIDLEGNILEQEWLNTGLNAPKDICIHGDKLYIADLSDVVEVDIPTASISHRYTIEGAHLNHNVCVDSQGAVYVSEMFAGKVFRILNGEIECYVEGLHYTAGLLAEDEDLYVLVSDGMRMPSAAGERPELTDSGKLIKVDREQKVTVIAEGLNPLGNGLRKISDKEFLVSCWSGMLYYVHADGTHQVLRDTREEHIPCGLLHWDASTSRLYMTTDERNKLLIFQLIKE